VAARDVVKRILQWDKHSSCPCGTRSDVIAYGREMGAMLRHVGGYGQGEWLQQDQTAFRQCLCGLGKQGVVACGEV